MLTDRQLKQDLSTIKELHLLSIEKQEKELIAINEQLNQIKNLPHNRDEICIIGDTHGDNLSLITSIFNSGFIEQNNTQNEYSNLLYYDIEKDEYIDRQEAIKREMDGSMIVVHNLFKTSKDSINKQKYANRKLMLMGDYIDRGKESLQNLLDVYELSKIDPINTTIIAGNHETHYNQILGNNNDLVINKLLCKMFKEKIFTTGKIIGNVLFTHTPTSVEVCFEALKKIYNEITGYSFSNNNIKEKILKFSKMIKTANLNINEFKDLRNFLFKKKYNTEMVLKQAKILFGNLCMYDPYLCQKLDWQNLMMEMMFERETDPNKHFLPNIVCAHSAHSIDKQLKNTQIPQDYVYYRDNIFEKQNNILYTDTASSYAMKIDKVSSPSLFKIPINNNKIDIENYKIISSKLDYLSRYNKLSQPKIITKKNLSLSFLREIIDYENKRYYEKQKVGEIIPYNEDIKYTKFAYLNILLNDDNNLTSQQKQIKDKIFNLLDKDYFLGNNDDFKSLVEKFIEIERTKKYPYYKIPNYNYDRYNYYNKYRQKNFNDKQYYKLYDYNIKNKQQII